MPNLYLKLCLVLHYGNKRGVREIRDQRTKFIYKQKETEKLKEIKGSGKATKAKRLNRNGRC